MAPPQKKTVFGRRKKTKREISMNNYGNSATIRIGREIQSLNKYGLTLIVKNLNHQKIFSISPQALFQSASHRKFLLDCALDFV